MVNRNSLYHQVSRSAENKSGTDYTAVVALSIVSGKVNELKKRLKDTIDWKIELWCSQ